MLHGIVTRRTDPNVTDLLDLAFDSKFAARPGNQTGNAVHRKWQNGGYAHQCEGHAESATSVAMNHISDEKSRRSSENYRCRKGTTFHPTGSRIHMCICHMIVA